MPSPTGMQIYYPQGHRLYLTGSERAAFRTAAEAAPREVRTYCWTLLYTGCRPSEALALTADRVDFQAAVLTFESKKKRRPGLYRAVPVPAALLDALDLVHGLRDRATRSYLWTWSLKTAYTRVIEIMARAGIAGPQASPKGLRHGFGVACIEKGSRSISCSAGWAMRSSPRQPSMPMRWARKSATSPPASGPDTRQREGRDAYHVPICTAPAGRPRGCSGVGLRPWARASWADDLVIGPLHTPREYFRASVCWHSGVHCDGGRAPPGRRVGRRGAQAQARPPQTP